MATAAPAASTRAIEKTTSPRVRYRSVCASWNSASLAAAVRISGSDGAGPRDAEEEARDALGVLELLVRAAYSGTAIPAATQPMARFHTPTSKAHRYGSGLMEHPRPQR